MDVFVVLMREVGLPLFTVALVVAAIVVVTHHLSKPKPVAATKPRAEREFVSDHPVGDHRLNHPDSDRWTGGDRKNDL